MLDLSLQVVEVCVLHEPLLVGEVFDDVGGFFGAEVRLLVQQLFFPRSPPHLLIKHHLLLNMLLIHPVSLDPRSMLLLRQHLLLLNIPKELVALLLPLALQVTQVVFEPVVGGFTGAPIALVSMLSLLLHVGVDGVRAL